jgi:hypothetical protein
MNLVLRWLNATSKERKKDISADAGNFESHTSFNKNNGQKACKNILIAETK